MQIELRPFLEWCDAREAQHKRALALQGASVTGARTLLLNDLGWSDEAGARRLYRWQREKVEPLADRDVIEDALDAAGVGFWEVYPNLDDGDDVGERRWCEHCHELVLVDEHGACLWCERPTRASAERQPVRWCEPCDRGVRANDDETCWRCGTATEPAGRSANAAAVGLSGAVTSTDAARAGYAGTRRGALSARAPRWRPSPSPPTWRAASATSMSSMSSPCSTT